MSRKLYACIAVLSACAFLSRSAHAQPRQLSPPPVAGPGPVPAPALVQQAPAELESVAEQAGHALHLVVGRSMFIRTSTRLRRVYVGDPVVLNSITDNPHRIFITAKSPGTSSLLLSDELGHSQAYLILADLDVSGLRADLEKGFPGAQMHADSLLDRVSLSGTVNSDAEADAAFKLASLYSKNVASAITVNRAHIKQVRLKVRFVEIDRSKLEQFGMNFFSGGKNTSATSTGQYPVQTSINGTSGANTGFGTGIQISNPLNLFLYNSRLNLGVALQDLESKQILQILAEPNIMTLSGQKASFLSGGEFPFPVIQGGGTGFVSITIQFQPYGVKLDFTPTVNQDGTILLKVAPEVSALDYTNAVSISGYVIPALSTRKAETQVELRDGQSFAISGLLDHRTTQLLSKVPGIGNVPILGKIFTSKNVNLSTVELLVIVTPTVVDPLTDMNQPREPVLPVAPIDNKKFDPVFENLQPATGKAMQR